MRYSYSIEYVKGAELYTADALSRQPLPEDSPTSELEEETSAYISSVLQTLPISDKRLEELQLAQQEDAECIQIREYVTRTTSEQGQKLPAKWASERHEFTVVNGILLKNSRLVIPRSMRQDMLQRLHQGHQGINKCRALARSCIWWPGCSKDIQKMVLECETCEKLRIPRKESLIPTPLSDGPWRKVGADLFEFQQKSYILWVDYYSRYVEVVQLHKTDSKTVIDATKNVFARHGIPFEMFTDNGPQFSGKEFKDFAEAYCFVHKTSSPLYPQANGEAERAVRTLKGLFRKSEDKAAALLAYRSTPLASGFSPAELLMSRKLRAWIPATTESLQPAVVPRENLLKAEEKEKERERRNYDRGAREVEPANPGDRVFLQKPEGQHGEIVGRHSAPRSYLIQTDKGIVRRNRKHFRVLKRQQRKTEQPTQSPQPLRRSTRVRRKPLRFREGDVME